MMDARSSIAELRAQAEAAIAAAATTRARSRSCASGSSAARPSCPTCCAASPSCRPRSAAPSASAANEARQAITRSIEESQARLAEAELEQRLARDRVDVTLPGTPPQPVGRLHLLTATRREIEDVFLGLGFQVLEGPEVETVHNNFDALNHSPAHPARARTDTFYTADDAVLRTHTSPMQVRAMEARPAALRRHPRAAPTGATTTRRTRRSSTRSRAWRSTPTSRSPT